MTSLTLLSHPRDFVRQRWRVLLWGVTALPVLIVYVGFQEPLMLLVLGGLSLSWMSVSVERRVGYRGEMTVVRRISGVLPEGYALFNQLAVPNPRSRTGATEIDAIVLGPTGITVIEVKSNRGTVIAGSDLDRYWPVRKVGRKGTVYYAQMRNPVRQATRQACALRHYLKSRGINVWVDALVVAGSRKTQWRTDHIHRVPLLPLKTRRIENALLGSNARALDDSVVLRAAELLSQLKAA
ncbi:hypothetical protein T35B1_11797 [Salinisphaera shabanensis T35B1]|uniref:nuclease-related domain-containing protein n=1 Tax=Salinisphaera TaxID=180541 RepID=UPI003342D858